MNFFFDNNIIILEKQALIPGTMPYILTILDKNNNIKSNYIHMTRM
jgi:hypothetical protein